MNHSLLKKTVFSLLLACIAYISGYAASIRATSVFSYHPDSVRVILEEEQRAAFNHFWQFANKQTGMIHASANVNNKNLTTGGSGFGVMVILTGIERGWITRKEGAKRILTLVRYLDKAERIKGVWSHWMNAEGQPVKFGKQIESGDLVETSFMMMGLYAAQAYLTENNPSGKLTLTFPLTTGQVPLYYNMKNTGRPLGLKSVSSEKYKSRYIDCPNEPLYPFGYGLSYATFEYSNIQPSSVIAEEGDKLQFSATVTNTGNVDGEDQLSSRSSLFHMQRHDLGTRKRGIQTMDRRKL